MGIKKFFKTFTSFSSPEEQQAAIREAQGRLDDFRNQDPALRQALASDFELNNPGTVEKGLSEDVEDAINGKKKKESGFNKFLSAAAPALILGAGAGAATGLFGAGAGAGAGTGAAGGLGSAGLGGGLTVGGIGAAGATGAGFPSLAGLGAGAAGAAGAGAGAGGGLSVGSIGAADALGSGFPSLAGLGSGAAGTGLLGSVGNVLGGPTAGTGLFSSGIGLGDAARFGLGAASLLQGNGSANAPNSIDLINAQTAANEAAFKRQLEESRVNQFTPFGSSVFSRDAAGRPVNTISLSPGQQALQNSNEASQLQLSNALGPATTRATGALEQPLEQDREAASARVRKALFDKSIALQQPGFDRQTRSLNDQLQQSGFALNNQAGQTLKGDLQRNQNAAIDQISNSAILAGGAEDSRLLDQMLRLRQAPLNELSALRSGTQVQSPGFSQFSTPGVSPTNVAGITNDAFANANTAQSNRNAQNNANLQGILGLFNRPAQPAQQNTGFFGGLFG